ncbi:MAG: N-acetyltransferase [Actinobacteria bacterium]|nr:MAG: N-acetyltransferase [Actinomycetota bacterium]
MSSGEVTLRGKRVVLRPLVEGDLAPLVKLLEDPEVAEWWIRVDEARLRKEALDDPRIRAFTIELDGEPIGEIQYAEEEDPDYRFAMMDVFVGRPWQGHGYGTEALRLLSNYLFEERGHHHLMIDPAASNKRAIAAYERVGFKPVGIMRAYERGPDFKWRDSLLMDMLREDLREK